MDSGVDYDDSSVSIQICEEIVFEILRFCHLDDDVKDRLLSGLRDLKCFRK